MNDAPANPTTKRVRRTQGDVVAAALRILDDQGLPDLTMRRLAEVLGVQPSALYWHFESKQLLLAAVSSRILAPLAQAEPAASLSATASVLGARLRDCLLDHRDGAELVSSSLALGLVDPPLHAALAVEARRLDAPAPLARTAAEAVTHFVIGYVFHEQQRLQADALGATGALAAERVPATFRDTLAMIVAGIDAPLTRSPGAPVLDAPRS
ncbi:TetR/AcrR family transcriptional regulator [Streptomyces bohaiensis]|uniref:TetR family transcriptional regulator n=1 Tax=Streptomyces bohaiensis TaxID=1431344 RepID=A0ABX1C6G0_9ACTN|nr:TetR/AcrR family transcriptional regulator [Streptomyces bohaiensis]NJQ14762.1 TetR family transcriptional regulator [Streptomyces bohaiensis]